MLGFWWNRYVGSIFFPREFPRHVWIIPHAHAPTVTEYRTRTVFLSRGEEENGREEMMHCEEVARVYAHHLKFHLIFNSLEEWALKGGFKKF